MNPAATIARPLRPLGSSDDAQAGLLANVRPLAGENPAPAARYHLVVIGAGTAG